MRRSIIRKGAGEKARLAILYIAGLFCLFFLFFFYGLLGRGIGSVASRFITSSQYSTGAVISIWNRWYPAYCSAPDADWELAADYQNSSAWLMKFILKQVPYYRNIKAQDGKHIEKELDPAYRNYVESHKILKEYEYLVRGLSGSAILASGNNPLSPGKDADSSGNSLSGQEGAGGNSMPETGPAAAGNSIAGSGILEKGNIPATGKQYIAAQLADYDFLMKHFYTVHPTTTAGREMMKAETFLSEDFSLTGGGEGPQILIYHTHSQEEFADYHDGNSEATIVGVGSYLTELLEQKGYQVIHDTSVYDLRDGKLDRSKAYTYALDGITGILQKYPSIQAVLDIHRDGVKEGTHLAQEIGGKQTATIMFFNGTSQTPTGPIEYLKNPYRTDNMAFSFQMKLCADAYYPGFTRRIYLKGLRYNMHLRARSALIEVGAQTNTYEEARNAMEPLSELLDMVLRPR